MNKIRPDGQRFVDEFSRERIFNGINVCDKGVFDGTVSSYSYFWDETYYETFYRNGFNLIRFGITWDAVEPQPGQYNDAYLAALSDILDKCAEKGIYCFIDMHQDLYSHRHSDGAPGWATLDEGHKFQPGRFVWAEGYFWGKAVQKAFDNFWNNAKVQGKGLQDYYADMWKHVAEKLGRHPAVIGFDLMNEPYPGSVGGKVFRRLIRKLVSVTLFDKTVSKKLLLASVFKKSERLKIANPYSEQHLRRVTHAADDLIKQFDLQTYSPFIGKVANAIREVNPDGIIFIENSYYSNLGIPCHATEVTTRGKRDASFAYAPHAYDIVADTPAYKHAGTARITSILQEQKRMQDRLNVPVVFGEWGGFRPDSEWYYHCHHIQALFDQFKWSNTYWAHFEGLFDSPIMQQVLCRPYPRAVTGKILDYHYDREKEIFQLRYNQEKEYGAPTEIFVHKPVKSITAECPFSIEAIENSPAGVVTVQSQTGVNTITIAF